MLPIMADPTEANVLVLRESIHNAPSARLALKARMALAHVLAYKLGRESDALRELRAIRRERWSRAAEDAALQIVLVLSRSSDVTHLTREAKAMAVQFPDRGASVTALNLARTVARNTGHERIAQKLERMIDHVISRLESSGDRRELATVRSERARRFEQQGRMRDALRLLRAELCMAEKEARSQISLGRIRARIAFLVSCCGRSKD